jgi:hypothetical protein
MRRNGRFHVSDWKNRVFTEITANAFFASDFIESCRETAYGGNDRASKTALSGSGWTPGKGRMLLRL